MVLSSTAITPLAKECLASCLANHESCRKRARLSTIWSSDNSHIIRDLAVTDLMPRRLLQILPNDAGLLLVDLGEKADEFPFVALSYCWGPGGGNLMTTRDKLASWKTEGLTLDILPATFVDAVAVTRGLGFQHLWIDALCIVQDDAEDWKKEAPHMAVIYGNAVCTLHAVDSASAGAGLFPRDLTTVVPGVLDTRAWTTQEMAISPRSLLFGKDGAKWECREAKATLSPAPTELTGLEKHVEGRGLKELFTFFRDWRSPGHIRDDEPSEQGYMDLDFGSAYDLDGYLPFHHAWWDFVSLYTERNLTVESDRFLAMNGIAAIAQRWARVRNTWGLWIDGLERELLWYVDNSLSGEVRAARTSKWLAPSWSWASLKGGARVRNSLYEHVRGKQASKIPTLMIKPEIRIPYGTSFDQSLPIPAWRSRESRCIELKGDLREGEVVASIGPNGRRQYEVKLNRVGRWSEDEKYDFRPDVESEFPVGQPVKVWCLLVERFDAEHCSLPESVLLSLVLRQRGPETEVKVYMDDVEAIDLWDERTFTRVGYLETTFSVMREWSGIYDDFWWKVVYLL
ncbi:heterokaryon incompatibility protein-domain-containing protein [Podospora didyma]|uniref:Heterokaryon incompatibility protein-domain-containing protein n=1 Tax=Podospora didyma TaxID=330526 RepID=A0AAE0NQR8_9PEZI|nr:heterokaryon incompatibility protein-domain-containing protein [Podospora didyma]